MRPFPLQCARPACETSQSMTRLRTSWALVLTAHFLTYCTTAGLSPEVEDVCRHPHSFQLFPTIDFASADVHRCDLNESSDEPSRPKRESLSVASLLKGRSAQPHLGLGGALTSAELRALGRSAALATDADAALAAAPQGHTALEFYKTLENVVTPVRLSDEMAEWAGDDCEERCSRSTGLDFACQAFVWAGRGSRCFLFGSVKGAEVAVVPGAGAALYQRPIVSGTAMESTKDAEEVVDCAFVPKAQVPAAFVHAAATPVPVSPAPGHTRALACGQACVAVHPSCQAYAVLNERCHHFPESPDFIPEEFVEGGSKTDLFVRTCQRDNRDVPIPFAKSAKEGRTKTLQWLKAKRRPVPEFNRNVVFNTERGKVRGKVWDILGMEVASFQKLPYAEPPVGQYRFNRSVLKEPWGEEVLDAAGERAPTCNADEDCLHLEIYTTQTDQSSDPLLGNRPVLVWIHGGHFAGGSHAQYSDEGFIRNLASRDVVAVSVQYRLKLTGWWTTRDNAAAGNWGLWDQVTALKWIQQEIHHFGGDPKRVTVHGESAGGASSAYLNRSPHCHGGEETFEGTAYEGWSTGNLNPLIQYAIPQSGVSTNIWAAVSEGPGDASDALAKAAGCWRLKEDNSTDTYAVVQCMRSLSFQEIKEAWDGVSGDYGHVILAWGPRVDGLDPEGRPNFQPRYTTQLKPVCSAVLIGNTKDEFGSYAYGGGFGGVATSKQSLVNDLDKYIVPDNIGPQYAIIRTIFEQKYLIPKQQKYDLLMNDEDQTNDPDGFYWALESIFVKSLLFWFLPAYQEAKDLQQNWNTTVYFYSYDYVSEEGFRYAPFPPGAFHGYELVFLMELNMDHYRNGNPVTAKIVEVNMTPDDLYAVKLMGDIWTNFAKHGTPTPGPQGYQNRNGSFVVAETFQGFPGTMAYFSINNDGISLHRKYYEADITLWDDLMSAQGIRFGG